MSSLLKHADAEVALASAELQLDFTRAPDRRTYISHQFASYPFHVCRAQYVDSEPEGLATVYLQSSSGGIFEDDDLSCEFHGLAHSQCHITTQASTIVHRMDNSRARHCVTIKAEESSFMEYMPEPVILFPNSDFHSALHLIMHPDSSIILVDEFTCHNPGENQDKFRSYSSETRIENFSGELLCLDRYHVSGEQFMNAGLGVMGDHQIQSTFLMLTHSVPPDELVELLRTGLNGNFDGYAGASLLPNSCGVIVRLLAAEAYQTKLAVELLWSVARNEILGKGPPNPRRK